MIDPTTPTTAAVPARRIDVSGLPNFGWDERSPVWWGNALLMFIESTTVAILLATYFYLRQNVHEWPPQLLPGTDGLVTFQCATHRIE